VEPTRDRDGMNKIVGVKFTVENTYEVVIRSCLGGGIERVVHAEGGFVGKYACNEVLLVRLCGSRYRCL
jgi:hypothetical protein